MNRRDTTVEAVVFDLGGVLVDVNPGAILAQWGIPEAAALGVSSTHRLAAEVKAFETGRRTCADFAETLIKMGNLPVSPQAFIREFSSWVREPFPGACELLEKVRQSLTVACLSNTNELHWLRIRDDFAMGSLFDHEFLSFHTGHLKPELTAFTDVLTVLRVPASRILYLDDRGENVKAAASLGFQAHHTAGIDAVSNAIARVIGV